MNWIPYYGVCAFCWFIAWAIGFWFFQSRRQHGPLLKRLSWRKRFLLFAAIALIPISYFLSNALYQRLLAAYPEQHNWLAPLGDLYIPVQFLNHPSWSFEPILYPLALVAVLLIPYVIHRTVSASRVPQPRVLGLVLTGLLSVACFIFMLGPI